MHCFRFRIEAEVADQFISDEEFTECETIFDIWSTQCFQYKWSLPTAKIEYDIGIDIKMFWFQKRQTDKYISLAGSNAGYLKKVQSSQKHFSMTKCI